MKKPKPNPHTPTLYLSISLGWLLLCPYATLAGPLKLTPAQAAVYFLDPAINFEIEYQP